MALATVNSITTSNAGLSQPPPLTVGQNNMLGAGGNYGSITTGSTSPHTPITYYGPSIKSYPSNAAGIGALNIFDDHNKQIFRELIREELERVLLKGKYGESNTQILEKL